MSIRINTKYSKGTHEVLQHLITTNSAKYKELVTSTAAKIPGDVVWVVATEDLETAMPLLKSKQWVSRIPGICDLCKKTNTCAMFRPYLDSMPSEFSFVPATWILPTDMTSLMATLESKRAPTVIIKPADGSQGDGIYLVQGKKDVCRKIDQLRDRGNGGIEAVVQKYLRHPYLYDGYKFDIRLYAVIMDVKSGESYMCHEGLVRFCTTPYDAPTARNLHQCTMHLTNYSINKMAKEFDHDDVNGSKRNFTTFMGQLAARGVDTSVLWGNIMELAQYTIGAVCKSINDAGLAPSCNAFHVIGLDVLLDKNLKPYLLELNNNPSMRIDATYTIDSGATPAPGKKPC
eukprot:PhF_6_TR31353/c0_g1_i1/m.45875/K16604/TTLL11; tubulin polyglutamylase TTLL11